MHACTDKKMDQIPKIVNRREKGFGIAVLEEIAMRVTRFMLVWALGLLGFASSANAALLGVCTFAGGCGPDFAMVGAPVAYDYNVGTGTGELSINHTVGNASFLDGQLDAGFSSTFGSTSLPVIPATGGNDAFNMSMTIDGSGNLISGSLTMNGKVVGFAGGPPVTATSFNGTLLDGNLIVGGTINQLGSDDISRIDFLGSINSSSLLTTAGYGTGLGGVLSLTQATITSSSGFIEWDEDWTATGSLDVVVPLPAAFWLFLSGLTALFSISNKARQKA